MNTMRDYASQSPRSMKTWLKKHRDSEDDVFAVFAREAQRKNPSMNHAEITSAFERARENGWVERKIKTASVVLVACVLYIFGVIAWVLL